MLGECTRLALALVVVRRAFPSYLPILGHGWACMSQALPLPCPSWSFCVQAQDAGTREKTKLQLPFSTTLPPMCGSSLMHRLSLGSSYVVPEHPAWAGGLGQLREEAHSRGHHQFHRNLNSFDPWRPRALSLCLSFSFPLPLSLSHILMHIHLGMDQDVCLCSSEHTV